MRPFKAGISLSSWLLRLSLVLFLFWNYFHIVEKLTLNSFEFYVAGLLLIFGTLLFVGGFLSRTSLTVFSAFWLFIIMIYKIIAAFNGGINDHVVILFTIISITFFFLCKGNKN